MLSFICGEVCICGMYACMFCMCMGEYTFYLHTRTCKSPKLTSAAVLQLLRQGLSVKL